MSVSTNQFRKMWDAIKDLEKRAKRLSARLDAEIKFRSELQHSLAAVTKERDYFRADNNKALNDLSDMADRAERYRNALEKIHKRADGWVYATADTALLKCTDCGFLNNDHDSSCSLDRGSK